MWQPRLIVLLVSHSLVMFLLCPISVVAQAQHITSGDNIDCHQLARYCMGGHKRNSTKNQMLCSILNIVNENEISNLSRIADQFVFSIDDRETRQNSNSTRAALYGDVAFDDPCGVIKKIRHIKYVAANSDKTKEGYILTIHFDQSALCISEKDLINIFPTARRFSGTISPYQLLQQASNDRSAPHGLVVQDGAGFFSIGKSGCIISFDLNRRE